MSHTVTNITAGVRRGSFSVVTKDEGASKWYSIKGGESSFEFAAERIEGRDGRRRAAGLRQRPKTVIGFTWSPASNRRPTSISITAPTLRMRCATAKRSFPWIWIVVAIAVVAIVAALVWFLFRPRGIVVPTDLSGKSVIAAAQELSSHGRTRRTTFGRAGREASVSSRRAGGRPDARTGKQYYAAISAPALFTIPSSAFESRHSTK